METGIGSCAGLGQDDQTAYYCSDLLSNCNNLGSSSTTSNDDGLDWNEGGKDIYCWDPLIGVATAKCESSQWKCSVRKANITLFFFRFKSYSFRDRKASCRERVSSPV